MNDPPFNPHMMTLLEMIVNWGKSCPVTVLDGGCGDAKTSYWLASQGCDVVGVDITLPLPPKVLVQKTEVKAGTLALINEDLYSIRLDKKFDVVALFGVLHYINNSEDIEKLLDQLRSWLLKDGLVVLSWISDDIPLVGRSAYLPSKGLILEIMQTKGYNKLRFWDITVEHTHDGNKHQHNIVYSAWKR